MKAANKIQLYVKQIKIHRVRIIKTFLFCYVRVPDVKTKAKRKCISYVYLNVQLHIYICSRIFFRAAKKLYS